MKWRYRNIATMIEANKVDASLAFFFNDGLKVVSDGTPMDWILLSDVGLPIYSTALLVNEDLIKKNPDLVRRFTRAFVEGWKYSLAHEQEALDAFLKDNPTVDAKYSALKLPEVLKLTQSAETEKNGVGYSSKEKWEEMQRPLSTWELWIARSTYRRSSPMNSSNPCAVCVQVNSLYRVRRIVACGEIRRVN